MPQKLIRQLQKTTFANDLVCNPYQGKGKNNGIRRKNLAIYFEQLLKENPTLLLVGEAPGYKGCRLTGIPFTSEKLLFDHKIAIPFIARLKGLQKTNEQEHLQAENTATMLWETLHRHHCTPILWNAFPFHPHKAKKPLTNRAPSKEELLIGRKFLSMIIELFQPTQIAAIGKKASASLSNMEIPHAQLRHPSFGGKADFVAGFERLVKAASRL